MQINFHTVNLKKKHPLQISRGVHDKSQNLFVEIVNDGITAWGESAPGKTEGAKTANEVQSHLTRLVDTGSENLSIYEVYQRSKELKIPACAQAGIDIALWDIKGKALNLPVSSLLGGQHRNKVVPYATGLYFSDSKTLEEDLVAEAKDYVNQGFKAIKMKVGLSIKQDVRNVKSVRAAIGPDIQLMVDSNHAYSLREAVELARKIEPYDIGWFEEPVSPEFYDQYAQLRNKTSIPIAGGECEYLRYGFLQLLQNKSVDIAQVEICASGGLTEAKRIASLASSFGVEVIPHVWGTGIGFHAALHFIANIEPLPGRLFPPDIFIEYDRTENAIRDRLTFPTVKMDKGYIEVPQSPGLGIDIDPIALKEFSTTSKPY